MEIAISLLSLIVSFIVLYRTRKFNELQSQLIKVQTSLGQLEIDRELREKTAENQSNLGINLVKIGKNYKLKVFNIGPAKAYDVTLTIVSGEDIVSQSWVDQIFPVEKIEVQQSFDILAHVSMGSKQKLSAKITWKDQDENLYEDVLHTSL